MTQGIIIRSLSGFYTVASGDEIVMCKARGRFRHDGTTPLVGDRVSVAMDDKGNARVDQIQPRRNRFIRPAVANIDQMVMFASAVKPVTDPFLIDRVCAIAELNQCEPVLCINKCDLNSADDLMRIYEHAGFTVVRVSAETGEGLEQLRAVISGKVNAFTGNSGVGKSSVLNRLCPELDLPTGAVSDKLGRGRHTTRTVELFKKHGGYIADTPGFSTVDIERFELIRKDELKFAFPEFEEYFGTCQFNSCNHVCEKGCKVLQAVAQGVIPQSRHDSYVRMYNEVKDIKEWQIN